MKFAKLFTAIIFVLIVQSGHALAWRNGTAPNSISSKSLINVLNQSVYPFKNYAKEASPPQANNCNFMGSLNADQYPVTTTPCTLSTTISVPGSYFGKFETGWTGQGSYSRSNSFMTVYSGCSFVSGCVTTPYSVFSGTISGTNPAVSYDSSLQITNVQADTVNGNLIQVTTGIGTRYSNGATAYIQNVGGTVGALVNGQAFTVSNVGGSNGTIFDLVGTIFSGTYTSGGNVWKTAPQFFTTALDGPSTFNTTSGTWSMSGFFVCRIADYTNDPTGCSGATFTGCQSAVAPRTDCSFDDDFLASLGGACNGSCTLRFLDVAGVDQGFQTNYSDNTPLTAITWNGVNWNPQEWAGVIGGTDSYSASCSSPCSFALQDGAIIQGQITNANLTMTPTLSVNTGTAIPIINSFGEQLLVSVGGTPTLNDTLSLTVTGTCVAGSPYTSTYTVTSADVSGGIATARGHFATSLTNDATLKTLAMYWVNNGSPINAYYNNNLCPLSFSTSVGGAATETLAPGTLAVGGLTASAFYTFVYKSFPGVFLATPGGLTAEWPYPVQIALCKALSAGCWLQAPVLYTDASMQALASVAAGSANHSKGVWPEYGNEGWNFGVNAKFTLAQMMGSSLGIGTVTQGSTNADWWALRVAQMTNFYKAAWGSQGGLYPVYAWQCCGGTSLALNGSTLCGSSCGNATYQSLVGTDYNTAPNRPRDLVYALSWAPYYSGATLTNGNYSASSAYSTFSCTGTVASNIFTVSGACTGTVYPNDGLTCASGCLDGAIITSQLTGQVTETAGAAWGNSSTTITLSTTVPATITAGMGIFDQTTGYFVGNVGSSTGAIITLVPGPNGGANGASKGANDTLVFFGGAGTYQLNSTASAASSSTVTGGEVLGMTAAADDNAGTGAGSQADAFAWMTYDCEFGTHNGQVRNNIAAFAVSSIYQGSNYNSYPAAGYTQPIHSYEGGYQSFAPTTGQATSLGISTSYGGMNGTINAMITAFRANSAFFNLVLYQYNLQVSTVSTGTIPAWFIYAGSVGAPGVNATDTWSLLSGDLYSAPWQSYDAIKQFNYLLKRDLDPASNDNTPMWLYDAA